jgi:hypothetical protein
LVVYLVIFGAAVRADGGSPSGSLRRRCENAVRISHDYAAACFLVTSGVGRHGPAEALVMRDLLVERGVAPARIVLETAARDTLESVRCCSRLLRERAPTPSRSWSVRAATTTCAAHCCSGWPGFAPSPGGRLPSGRTSAPPSGYATCTRGAWRFRGM